MHFLCYHYFFILIFYHYFFILIFYHYFFILIFYHYFFILMLTAQRQEHLQTEYWVAWYRGLSFRRSSRSRGMSNNKNCTAFWAGEGDFIYPTLNPTVGPKGCYWKKCVARHAERLVLYVKIWDHPPKRFWDQTPVKIHEELSALQERRSRHQLSWQVGQRSICWRHTKIQLYWGVFWRISFQRWQVLVR